MTTWNSSSDFNKSVKLSEISRNAEIRRKTLSKDLQFGTQNWLNISEESTGSLNDIHVDNCLWLFCDALTHTTVEGTMKNDWIFLPQIEKVIQDENFVLLVVVTSRLLTKVKDKDHFG